MELFNLESTIQTLENGGLILYPSDTIWGIGCDATNSAAATRILQLIGRETGEGMVSLVDNMEMLLRYTGAIHPRLQTLLEYHVRPLTMIYPKVKGLAPEVLASNGSAAIRICNEPFCQALISAFGKPLVSVAAHLPGEPFPTHYGAISSDVIQQVDHVVKYRQREKPTDKQPSLIARWSRQNEIEPVRS